MANEVKKVNNVAITDIKNINGQTDADIKKINTKEFTGLGVGSWSASSASLGTARSTFFSAQGSTRDAMSVIGGLNTSGLSGRLSTEEEYDGVSDAIGSGQTIGISGIMAGAGSVLGPKFLDRRSKFYRCCLWSCLSIWWWYKSCFIKNKLWLLFNSFNKL
jgi:hypothetical protein